MGGDRSLQTAQTNSRCQCKPVDTSCTAPRLHSFRQTDNGPMQRRGNRSLWPSAPKEESTTRTGTTRRGASCGTIMPPPRDRRSRCWRPRSPEHCASPPLHMKMLWRQTRFRAISSSATLLLYHRLLDKTSARASFAFRPARWQRPLPQRWLRCRDLGPECFPPPLQSSRQCGALLHL